MTYSLQDRIEELEERLASAKEDITAAEARADEAEDIIKHLRGVIDDVWVAIRKEV